MPHVQTTNRPTYPRVPHSALNAAQMLAEATVREAHTRTGRVMCHIIAAGVRDILTGNDPDPEAPFDAVLAELIRDPSGIVHLSGTYWTAAGERGELDPHGVFELNAWAAHLDETNEHVWTPLCELIDDEGDTSVYRMDLVRAAHSPIDAPLLPAHLHRVSAVWERLTTALPRPWHTRETLHNADGGAYESEAEAHYVSVEIVTANGMRVAELGASIGPGDVGDGHERQSVLAGVRADAELIARAPEDLAYLLTQLDQAQDLMTRMRGRQPGPTCSSSGAGGAAIDLSQARADELNNAARFLSRDSDDPGTLPCIETGGTQVYAYWQPGVGLCVSLHLDTVPTELQSPRKTVPMRITVGDHDVFTAS